MTEAFLFVAGVFLQSPTMKLRFGDANSLGIYRRSTFSASCFWCPQTLADGITALLFRITDFWLLVLLLGQDTSEFRAQPILLIIYLVSLKWRAHFLWQIPFHCYGHHKAVFWAGPSRFLELEWRDSRELMWLSLFQHRDSPVFHRRFYHFAPRRRISWFKLVGHLVILLVGFWCLKQHPDALASLSQPTCCGPSCGRCAVWDSTALQPLVNVTLNLHGESSKPDMWTLSALV